MTLGVGLSLPGLIDRENGVLLGSTNMPRWRNVPIAETLERSLKLPVKVERSIHLAAYHERWSEPRQHNRSTLVLSLRTGIGMSLMHMGEIYVGSRGFDGEIGHTIVDINGKLCECGGRGCLETFVSASAVCERAKTLMERGGGGAIANQLRSGERLRPELIYRLAKEGDSDSADIVRDVGRYIGIAVSNMINLFAPDDVVICGSIDTADELIVEAVRRQMEQSALPQIRERVTVRLARAKEKACLLGAAVLVAGELFDLPKLNYSVIRDVL
jgi:predicted NBD/HSP70 family sugar kinase